LTRSCTACPVGTYARPEGSSTTQDTACLPCSEGTFSASTGAKACDMCPAGWVARVGAARAHSLHQACSECPEGTHGSGVGPLARCLACPTGTCSTPGSTLCAKSLCAQGLSQQQRLLLMAVTSIVVILATPLVGRVLGALRARARAGAPQAPTGGATGDSPAPASGPIGSQASGGCAGVGNGVTSAGPGDDSDGVLCDSEEPGSKPPAVTGVPGSPALPVVPPVGGDTAHRAGAKLGGDEEEDCAPSGCPCTVDSNNDSTGGCKRCSVADWVTVAHVDEAAAQQPGDDSDLGHGGPGACVSMSSPRPPQAALAHHDDDAPAAALVAHLTGPVDHAAARSAPVAPSSVHRKVWRLRNTGSTPWPPGTRVVLISGTIQGAVNDAGTGPAARGGSLSARGTVLEFPPGPGDTVDVALPIQAPPSGSPSGRCWGHWRLMTRDGVCFGPILHAELFVASPASEPSST
jgi:hypothetical protein